MTQFTISTAAALMAVASTSGASAAPPQTPPQPQPNHHHGGRLARHNSRDSAYPFGHSPLSVIQEETVLTLLPAAAVTIAPRPQRRSAASSYRFCPRQLN